MERALQHQIRHEYNKTGRHSNVTNIEDDHVTIVLDLIQVKVESADSHAVQWTCRETGTEVYWNGATRGHMSPLTITRPSQPLCAGPSVNVNTVCYHGHMCMCKHAHLYRSASAANGIEVGR